MSKKRKKRKKLTIGQLLERERRGEDLQLHPSARELYTVIKGVIVYVNDEFDEHPRVRDFLLNLIWISPLPARGRPRKGLALTKQEEEELAKERDNRIAKGLTWERAANRLLDRTKGTKTKPPRLFMKNKTLNIRMSVATVIDRLKRSPAQW